MLLREQVIEEEEQIRSEVGLPVFPDCNLLLPRLPFLSTMHATCRHHTLAYPTSSCVMAVQLFNLRAALVEVREAEEQVVPLHCSMLSPF